MTIWEILQIEPTGDQRAIREAYSRRLKVTKPEVDPEGFKQLREAYEAALKAKPFTEPKPISESTDAKAQAIKMIGELSQTFDPYLLRKWKKEGAFYHFGVSHYFQECLLDLLSEFIEKPLFLYAYFIFDWNQLRQKPSHPLAKKLERVIGAGNFHQVKYLSHSQNPVAAAWEAIKAGKFDIAEFLYAQTQDEMDRRSISGALWYHGFTSFADDLSTLPPLHTAIFAQDHAQFDALLLHSDINERCGPSYFSPLFVAVKVRNLYAYQRLIDLGALDLPTSCHHTALFAAVYNGDLPIVRELILRGSDPYQYSGIIFHTLVFTAVRYGQRETLQFLLEYGLHPDDVGGHPGELYQIQYGEQPELARTPLNAAVQQLDPVMVQMLLEAGANPNRPSGGIPPLQRAILNLEDDEMVQRAQAIIALLIENGADVHQKADDGDTFHSRAVKLGLLKEVESSQSY
ncbi:MAG: ankyrin repeat domain-containing protein [Verrucomicrobia bacterium]|nr:ankyrin repeat domain-containing protein [Verrucomicrobiota bacterium]